ncbi:tyrosine-type recombinase/integrase [Sinorhizobium medicae]|nr:tyrosine-type recombinase/integrase [Sinorhizobium medicae]MDX0578222.1 tyrosine-type recombinase/integrase [Sinorhizobium medicae]MDX0780066.1 tyrosine-type recombinase/integrase [Sinorhizobium medicae]
MLFTKERSSPRLSSDEIQARLETILKSKFDGKTIIWNRKKGISRAWIAELVGCTPATLSKGRFRRRIVEFEVSQRPAHVSSHRVSPANDNVELLHPKRRDGYLIKTSIRLNGNDWEIPAIIWPSGLEEETADWFRYLIVNKKRAFSGVEEVAKHMRQFRKFRRRHRISLKGVNDSVLIRYQDELRANGVSQPRRNALLRTVHLFYRYAEEAGVVRHMVQIGRPSSYAEPILSFEFPISSQEINIVLKSGRTKVSWVWPFLETGDGSRYGRRHTPNFAEVDKIFSFTDIQRHGRRNVLIMNWALRTGARVSEILSIRLEDLPQLPLDFDKLAVKDQWVVRLRKRKRRRNGGVLYAPADLIWDTLDYIRTEREETILKRGKSRPKNVFVSERGEALVPDSVSRICGYLFRAAQVYNANIHRLRARFAHNAVELTLLQLEEIGVTLDPTSGWHETALIITAQVMGHSSPMSLRPYLDDILLRRSEEARLRAQAGLPATTQLSPGNEAPDLAALVRRASELLESRKTVEAWATLRRVSNLMDRSRLFGEDWMAAA